MNPTIPVFAGALLASASVAAPTADEACLPTPDYVQQVFVDQDYGVAAAGRLSDGTQVTLFVDPYTARWILAHTEHEWWVTCTVVEGRDWTPGGYGPRA